MSMYMPPTPAGRYMDRLTGDPDTIKSRGTEIETLGEQMTESATLLRTISTRASAGQGQAIDKLRESIGDSWKTLEKAGQLYTPVGPVIRHYGERLETLQPLINGKVEEAQEEWLAYVNLPGSVEPRGTGGWFQPEEGSPEAEQQAEEDAAKKAAYETWQQTAGVYDIYYDSWESAFEAAADGITDEMAGKIEDGGWRSFLDWASGALGWAGLVVGVAALIIGGPILAAIALVVGVLALAVTITQAMQFGDKNGWDIALAAVAVFPIGKLSPKLLRPDLADEVASTFKVFKPSTWTAPFKTPTAMDGLVQTFRTEGAWSAGLRGLTGYSAWDAAGVHMLYNIGDFGQTFKYANWGLGIELGYGAISNVLKYQGWYSRIDGGSTSWKSMIPGAGFFF